MDETVPLAAIQEVILQFLCDRDDAALFGAQAVNAYVDQPRMSQDVDILALDAVNLAEELRSLLHSKFHIAVRVRSVAKGNGYRVYQARKPSNRHLADIRQVMNLPPCQRIERVFVPRPEELMSQKIISMVSRSKTAKGMTDIADLRRLLLTFPDLKKEQGSVHQALTLAGASPSAMMAWQKMVAEEIEVEDESAGY